MIKLVAVVENAKEREKLRIKLIFMDVMPCIHKDAVSVSLPSDDVRAEELIELFEKYTRHEIHLSN
jgi:hypothetical protein